MKESVESTSSNGSVKRVEYDIKVKNIGKKNRQVETSGNVRTVASQPKNM